jgi:N-methylhydantoinase A
MKTTSYFIGVDIGGSFTDVVLTAAAGGSFHTSKKLTTPDNPGRGVISAIEDALKKVQAAPGDVERVAHATTLATNLILERKGSKVGYVATRGFGDLFVIGKERVVGADRYDLLYEKQPPLVPRRLTAEVDERMDHRGEVVEPLNESTAIAALRRLAGEKPDAVAICLLHAYANPAHEKAVAELVRWLMPTAYIALSSESLA